MQLSNGIILLVLGLSLAIQAITIAAMGLGIRTANDYDDISPAASGSPSAMQQHIGIFTYALLASALCCLAYIYLLVSKLLNKSVSQIVDWCCYAAIVSLQFGIAVVFSIDLTNDKVNFQTLEKSLNALKAAGTTGRLVDNLTNQVTVHNLQLAAAVLTFVIGFLGGVILLVKHTLDLKSQPSVHVGEKDRTRNQLDVNQITGV